MHRRCFVLAFIDVLILLCVVCVCVLCLHVRGRTAEETQALAQVVHFESHAKSPICKVSCCRDKSCSASRRSSQNVCVCVVLWLCKVQALVLSWLVSRCDGIAALSSLRHDAVIDVIGMLELTADACCRVAHSVCVCVRLT
jgi:hypothetical protein